MLISVVQNEVLLSDAEAHQCMWASTANLKGGCGRNIEIDLLQENCNKNIKKQIKIMGENKTDKTIDRSNQSSGGERVTVENFDYQVNRGVQFSSHTHQSSAVDEEKIVIDLHALKPFKDEAGRRHNSFEGIMPDPLATLDKEELDKWLRRYKRNLLLDAPILYNEKDEL